MERMLEAMAEDTVNDVDKEDTFLDCPDNMPSVNWVKIEHVEVVVAVLQVNEETVETHRNSVVDNHMKTVSEVVHRIHEDEVGVDDNLDPHVGA